MEVRLSGMRVGLLQRVVMLQREFVDILIRGVDLLKWVSMVLDTKDVFQPSFQNSFINKNLKMIINYI